MSENNKDIVVGIGQEYLYSIIIPNSNTSILYAISLYCINSIIHSFREARMQCAMQFHFPWANGHSLMKRLLVFRINV